MRHKTDKNLKDDEVRILQITEAKPGYEAVFANTRQIAEDRLLNKVGLTPEDERLLVKEPIHFWAVIEVARNSNVTITKVTGMRLSFIRDYSNPESSVFKLIEDTANTFLGYSHPEDGVNWKRVALSWLIEHREWLDSLPTIEEQ